MLTKMFSASNPKALSRSKAWTCVAINQLACPGLGTIMAGRWSGYLQAAIMLLGFFLTMGFMLCCMFKLIRVMFDSQSGAFEYKQIYGPYAWAGLSGVA